MPGRRTLTATTRPFGIHSLVDLGDRCGADRLGIEAGVKILERRAERRFDDLADRCKRGGGKVVLQLRRFSAARSPTRSGRVDSAWPSLIAAGPISCSAAA